LVALEFDIPTELSRRLEEASRPEVVHPYVFFDSVIQQMINGGVTVRAEPRWFR
jgi:hypothetical protein